MGQQMTSEHTEFPKTMTTSSTYQPVQRHHHYCCNNTISLVLSINLPKFDESLVKQQRHKIPSQVVPLAREQQYTVIGFRPELDVDL